jgi:hypothetical protein
MLVAGAVEARLLDIEQFYKTKPDSRNELYKTAEGDVETKFNAKLWKEPFDEYHQHLLDVVRQEEMENITKGVH